MAGKRKWEVLKQLPVRIGEETKIAWLPVEPPVPIRNAQQAESVLKKMDEAVYKVVQVSLECTIGPDPEAKKVLRKNGGVA